MIKFILFFMCFVLYLLNLGSKRLKSEDELAFEDEEQAMWLRNHR